MCEIVFSERIFTMSAELHCIILDCKHPQILSAFYEQLLGWQPFSDSWYGLISPQGIKIEFQSDKLYQPPLWPSQAGVQGQMMHLDFYVEQLAQSVSLAQDLGATVSPIQFYVENQCVTLFDIEGHPFCLLQAH